MKYYNSNYIHRPSCICLFNEMSWWIQNNVICANYYTVIYLITDCSMSQMSITGHSENCCYPLTPFPGNKVVYLLWPLPITPLENNYAHHVTPRHNIGYFRAVENWYYGQVFHCGQIIMHHGLGMELFSPPIHISNREFQSNVCTVNSLYWWQCHIDIHWCEAMCYIC